MPTPTFRPYSKPVVTEDAKTLLKTVTRRFAVPGPLVAGDSSQFFTPRGTADVEYPDCYLIDQRIDPTGDTNSATLTQVYQQLGAVGVLVAMGEGVDTVDEEGRETQLRKFVVRLPYDANAAMIGVVSGEFVTSKVEFQQVNDIMGMVSQMWVQANATLTEIGNPDFKVGADNRRTTQRKFIQRAASAFTAGVVGTDTYSGGVLAEESVEVNAAVRTVTRTYVELGEVSRSEETRNNGKLFTTTIQTVGTVPSTPSGYTLTRTTIENANGLSNRTYVFVKGEGRLSIETSSRNNGNLTLTTITYLGTDDGALPSGVLVTTDSKQQDGYVVYTKAYAQGSGEISRRTDVILDGRVTYTTVRALGAAVAAPGQFETSVEDGDGYEIHTSRGVTINSSDLPDAIEYREGGALTITTKRKINAAPTGSGSLVEISDEPREGFTLYTRRYVVGLGTTSTETRYEEGALVIVTQTSLIALTDPAPALPASLLSRTVRKETGYQAITDRYITAGAGQTSYSEQGRPDGSIEYSVTSFGSTETVPASPVGSTYLVAKRHQPQPGGYYVNQATYIKVPATMSLPGTRSFSMPGLAYFSGAQVITEPPVNRLVNAVEEVTYGTTTINDAPYYVTKYSMYYAGWVTTEDGVSHSTAKSMEGYLGSGGVSGINGTFNGVECDSYIANLTTSNPATRPSGAIVLGVSNDPYLTALDGTVVYRRVKITATV